MTGNTTPGAEDKLVQRSPSHRHAGETADVPLTASFLLSSPRGRALAGLDDARLDRRKENTASDEEHDSEILVGLQSGDSEARLSAARALRELVEVEQIRAALSAERDGRTQREIGRLLGVSQTEVHRMLRRAKNANTDWVRVAPRELVLRYRAGLISRGTLFGRLNSLEEGQAAPNSDDGYAPGTWDQVRDAFMDGLLAESEYEELRDQSRRTDSAFDKPTGPGRPAERGNH